MVKEFNWCGYKWKTQERWGNIHAEKLYCWYNAKCVNVDNYNYLHLLTKKDPKKFRIQHENNQTVVSQSRS